MRTEQQVNTAIETYSDMVLRLCGVYLKNDADAEDIFQTVFLKYTLRQEGFDSAEHEKAWFIRVTQNKCLDYLKKSGRKNECIDDVPATATYKDNDMEQDVIAKVIALPEKYKSAIILFYYNEYTVEEISKTLKISKSAVKKRLQRGRDILKLELEDYAL